ncbi:MAG: type IV secretory system conjugative DNA transfer family protein [Cyanobacteria bacterium J06626_18]
MSTPSQPTKFLAQTSVPADSNSLEPVIGLFKSQSGAVLIGCLAIVLLLSWLGRGNQKGVLGTAFWGGSKEKAKAKKKAKQQMATIKRNSVALYVGTPPFMQDRLEQTWQQKGLMTPEPKWKKQLQGSLKGNSSTLYLPDAQRGISVCGAAGSGKTFSIIDPLIRSTLDQGFPMVLYDFKYPAQTKRAVAYAMKRGYTVRVFAPGFPETEVCNPLDLVRDEEDAIAAGQLAQVISKNFNSGGGKGDKFFEEAGDNLIEGILLVTKAIGRMVNDDSFCDLMMAQAVLSLDQLPYRLEQATNDGTLNVWTTRPLSQLVSVKESEKTVAGILAIAQRMFLRFLKKDFIGAFCGPSTLPLDLDGKQLLVFGLDRNNRDIVGPLLAAIMHMVVTRNVSRTVPRTDPLVVALDELPTLYLPQLVNWLNENREDGFCGILGYQNIAQLEKAYGKEMARAIFGGTACKFLFNPQDVESAKLYADYLGEQTIQYKSKSRSTSGKSGSSRSQNDNYQKRHLLEPSQMLKLGTGRSVIINPALQRANEAYVPLLQNIKVPKADIAEMNWSEAKWDEIRKRLINRNGGEISDELRRQQFEERRELAEKLFPLPEMEEVPAPYASS